jgi:enoyl-CoA hydratase/carnithine racemase
MTGEPLRVTRRGSTALLTVDRVGSKNAINRTLATAMVQAFARAADDPALHAIVIASADRDVFLAGGDIAELSQLPYDETGAAEVLALGEELGAIERCPVPVIAAVDGAVFGGGCELLVMCDLVVMSSQARLRFVHARMGLVPAWGGTTRLIERVGATRAADLLLTAREVDGEEAARIGLASRLVEPGQALDAALALAEELAAVPRDSLAAIKASVVAAKTSRRAGALEAEQERFRAAWGSPAHREAFARFLGRRRSPTS